MPHTVIIGAGIIGVATAYYLSHSASSSASDHTITIVDPCTPASGASGKAAGFLSRSGWTGPRTASLEELSFKLYKELAEQHEGAEEWGFRVCDVLIVICGTPKDPSEELEWNPSGPKSLETVECDKDLNWLKPEIVKSQSLLGEKGSFAQCDPHLFTISILAAAKSKGVRFLQVGSVEVSGESGPVTFPCDNVVLAAGPWTRHLSESFLPKPIPISPYAGHSIIVKPSVAPTADCLMAIIHTDHTSYRAQIFPRNSGEIYICGINDELPLPSTPEAAIPIATEIAKLKETADTILPEFSIETEQLCFRPMTAEGLPFIGLYPGIEGLYVAAGHSHYGIILGPGTGKVLSEMILGEELSADLSQLPTLR